jgi:hypothetical protein
VGIVLDPQQPAEIVRHRRTVGLDLFEQRDGLSMVLSARPPPQ